MSPLLEKVLQDIEQLTAEEQVEVLNHTTEQLKRRTQTQGKPQKKWLDLAGTAPYPLVGEDAQEWVTRTRQESQEHRDRLLRIDHED
ncbi:hypothetical protein NG796_24210 [Laspinema sp. A4]|uniref:hypothetical protein n=1 Tax=Laspinema sp. D2d TaxID=2953686 RepID=UPI0021BA7A46|nr:hypothetical protein [Laspinema sp. D2d]MCT7986379.1 hypothetical protein [Laspinema sp. D2d]